MTMTTTTMMMIWILCSTGALVVGYPSSAELNVPAEIGDYLTYLLYYYYLPDLTYLST